VEFCLSCGASRDAICFFVLYIKPDTHGRALLYFGNIISRRCLQFQPFLWWALYIVQYADLTLK
jgi:hypothetical protein